MSIDRILSKDIYTLLWECKESMMLMPLWKEGRNDQEMLGNCNKQLKVIQTLLESLRKTPKIGDKMYWIIYCTYLCDLDPDQDGIDAILMEIANQYEAISRATYFRLRDKAIAEIKRNIDFLIKFQIDV